ncbi:MAG: polyphenol oxidase family protein [Candidatus Nanopelagicales bacterium]
MTSTPDEASPARLWGRVAFTGRDGGVSTGVYASLNLGDHVGDDPVAVAANRSTAAGRAGLAGDRLAIMRAAHGCDHAVADRPGTYADVDILVTTDPDLGLLALAADCVPLALVDPEVGIAAAVHSGWRGVAADAAGAAVTAMTALGAEPRRLRVRIGAAICPRCYEVSADVRDQVAAAAPAAAAVTASGTPAVDLHAGVTEQLRRRGVTTIAADPTCTFESPDFFSHRRDGVTGRHGVVVRLPEPA